MADSKKVQWAAWAACLLVASVVMVVWAYSAVSRVTESAIVLKVPGPDVRANMPAGDIGFYYEYAGRPPSSGEKWVLSQFIRNRPRVGADAIRA